MNLTGATIYPYSLSYQYYPPAYNAGELKNEISGSGGIVTGNQYYNDYTNNFVYDNAGNGQLIRNEPFGFNQDDQYNNPGYAYDGNGNPTTFANNAITYDKDGHATNIPYVSNGTTGDLNAMYGADGLRAWKSGANGTSYYIYDRGAPLAELNNSGKITAFNVWGPTGLLERFNPAPGSSSTGPIGYQYQFDPQGNVFQRYALIENSAYTSHEIEQEYAPIDTAIYDAYGNLQTDIDSDGGQNETSGDPLGYGAEWGNQTDPETGLVLMGQRYYAPGNGRFLTRDPIGTAGGLNLYEYAGDNPVTNIDPNGTRPTLADAWNVLLGYGTTLAGYDSGISMDVGSFESSVQSYRLMRRYGYGRAEAMTLSAEWSGIKHAFTDAFNPHASPQAQGSSLATLQFTLGTIALGGLAGAGAGSAGAAGDAAGVGAETIGDVARSIPISVKNSAVAAFRDNSKLALMTAAEREQAASMYERAAPLTRGSFPNVTRLYNLERARFLRGQVSHIAPDVRAFAKEYGLPMD